MAFAYVTVYQFPHGPSWAATFRLRGFNLVHAVVLCDPITGCEAYSFTTDGYGIFNVQHTFGRVPYTRRIDRWLFGF